MTIISTVLPVVQRDGGLLARVVLYAFIIALPTLMLRYHTGSPQLNDMYDNRDYRMFMPYLLLSLLVLIGRRRYLWATNGRPVLHEAHARRSRWFSAAFPVQ